MPIGKKGGGGGGVSVTFGEKAQGKFGRLHWEEVEAKMTSFESKVFIDSFKLLFRSMAV